MEVVANLNKTAHRNFEICKRIILEYAKRSGIDFNWSEQQNAWLWEAVKFNTEKPELVEDYSIVLQSLHDCGFITKGERVGEIKITMVGAGNNRS